MHIVLFESLKQQVGMWFYQFFHKIYLIINRQHMDLTYLCITLERVCTLIFIPIELNTDEHFWCTKIFYSLEPYQEPQPNHMFEFAIKQRYLKLIGKHIKVGK